MRSPRFESSRIAHSAMMNIQEERYPLAETFTISRGAKTEAHVVTVELTRDGITGRGECVPYARYGETLDSVIDQLAALPADIGRDSLQQRLPAGAARNALDCALWDWEARRTGTRVWRLAGLPEPGPLVTAYTLSLDTPERMQAAAARHATRPLLKIKLGSADDMARLEAVRRGAPDATIIVDANEGWTTDLYAELAPHLVRLGVAMVEQPLPADEDEPLAHMSRPLPVCADESCHDRSSLPALAGKYDMINIKLDKTGGLTEALALRAQAQAVGYRLMVGCMVGTSLSMAPAVVLAQGAEVVDLDGPLLLARDRTPGLRYDAAGVHPPDASLWG